MVKYYYVEIRGDDHEVVEEYEITDGEAASEEEAERIALQRFLTFRDYKAVCIGMEDDGQEEEPSAQVKPGLLPGDPDEEY